MHAVKKEYLFLLNLILLLHTARTYSDVFISYNNTINTISKQLLMVKTGHNLAIAGKKFLNCSCEVKNEITGYVLLAH